MKLLLNSGVFGLLIIVGFFAILVTGAIVVGILRSRRSAAVFGLLALIPLVLGLCGTYLGNLNVDRALQSMPPEPAPDLESMEAAGRRAAMSTTYLGSGASAVLLLAAGCGLVLTNRPNKSEYPIV